MAFIKFRAKLSVTTVNNGYGSTTNFLRLKPRG